MKEKVKVKRSLTIILHFKLLILRSRIESEKFILYHKGKSKGQNIAVWKSLFEAKVKVDNRRPKTNGQVGGGGGWSMKDNSYVAIAQRVIISVDSLLLTLLVFSATINIKKIDIQFSMNDMRRCTDE